MIPDLNFSKEAFNRFNVMIFGSMLPIPRFTLTKARTFRGKLRYTHGVGRRAAGDLEIRLSLSFDLPREEWEDVMIHEMIHLFIDRKSVV